jgi:hypothetical protein
MWFTDAVDPLGLMKSIRGAVKHDGTYLMLEMNRSPKLEENANLWADYSMPSAHFTV